MVSSQLPGLANNRICKPLLIPVNPMEAAVTDHVELDFADVFGPLPVQAPIEVNYGDFVNPISVEDVSELIYDDPAVIYSRSHSLVGPSSCVGQSLKLSMLTIHETEDLVELVDSVNGDTIKELQEASTNDTVMETPLKDLDGNFMKVESVGIEDFEILKFVGQGAFAKVYQVRKKGTTEIYAMKVMRKDKIMENNHAEYMKAERDILTNVDHPFIVQLRYSFQAMLTDFGMAKKFDENTRSNSMCGTLEYMSPEIILGKGHDKAADWWSVGILLFEMLTGKPPFTGNREKIQQKIVKEKIKLPAFLSSESHSLLKGLLQKEASKRLGSGPTGSEEITRHKWFKPINWKKLEARQIQPSFRPEVAGKQCVANFEKRWTDMPVVVSPAASPNASGNVFMGFSYVKPAASFLQKESPRYP
ncbi:serine/threonine-protein kinase atpk2/atpk19 [Quercus suber]|uniref:Serine/threonine-protein kinase atpk2/atpk19 n=1 Tax=Quercus suber TaxID=58331 RepID=A0AAW0L8R9_QUESU